MKNILTLFCAATLLVSSLVWSNEEKEEIRINHQNYFRIHTFDGAMNSNEPSLLRDNF